MEVVKVARTQVTDDLLVSTVELPFDHSFGGPRPMTFETMVFGGDRDEYSERYSTREEALAGHERIVAMVTDGAEKGTE